MSERRPVGSPCGIRLVALYDGAPVGTITIRGGACSRRSCSCPKRNPPVTSGVSPCCDRCEMTCACTFENSCERLLRYAGAVIHGPPPSLPAGQRPRGCP